MTGHYAAFDRLLIDRPAPHVVCVTIANPLKMNALDAAAHVQMIAFEMANFAGGEASEAMRVMTTKTKPKFESGGNF